MTIYKLYFSNAGVPASGLTPTFDSFTDLNGSTVAGIPTISGIYSGWYKFSYAPSESAVGVIDGGSSLDDADRYLPFEVTVQDAYLDLPQTTINTNVLALPTISTIVSSGNAEGWDQYGDATLANQQTMLTYINTISGYTDSLESGQTTINNNVLARPEISTIINSGDAAGWGATSSLTVENIVNAVYTHQIDGVSMSGIQEVVLSYITGKIWKDSSDVWHYYGQDNTSELFAAAQSGDYRILTSGQYS